MKRPNLFILGGQKCGTTALAQFLDQHPDICLAQGKEAHVFDDPAHLNASGHSQASFAQLDAAYAKKFADARQQQYWCDATPIYAYWSQLLPAISAYSAQAKVILMVRDPVERAISHYMMERARGIEKREMLTAFMSESSRLKAAAGDWGWQSPLRTCSYLQRGRFSDQLAALLRVFDRSNVLIMHNDELRYQHHRALERIFRFLQLPNHGVEPETVFASSYSPPSWSDRLAIGYAHSRLYRERQWVKRFQSLRQAESHANLRG